MNLVLPLSWWKKDTLPERKEFSSEEETEDEEQSDSSDDNIPQIPIKQFKSKPLVFNKIPKKSSGVSMRITPAKRRAPPGPPPGLPS